MGQQNTCNDSDCHRQLLLKMSVIDRIVVASNGKPVADDDCRVNGAYYRNSYIVEQLIHFGTKDNEEIYLFSIYLFVTISSR